MLVLTRARVAVASVVGLLAVIVGPAVAAHAATPWVPPQGQPWQWQLSGTLDTSVDVPTYDVNGFGTSPAQVAALHAARRHAICYVNVGAFEPGRPDAGSFPQSVLGSELVGWPGERWLDVRQLSVLAPIIEARFDMCRAKGFDAVEPDNVDGYANSTGFPLGSGDQLAFNRMVAAAAHARGMSVALKNDLGQVPQLVDAFDFAVNEQCFAYAECDQLSPFLAAGKAVLNVEYDLTPAQFCPSATSMGTSSMAKNLGLDAWRQAC